MSKFVSDSVYLLIQKIISVLLVFGTLVLVSRALGPDGQGQYSLLTSLSRTFFYFFSFGAHTAFVFSLGQEPRARGDLVKSFFPVTVILGLFAAFGCIIFMHLGQNNVFESIDSTSLSLAILGVLAWFINSYTWAILNGIEKIKELSISQFTQSLVLVSGIAVLFFISEKELKYYVAVFVFSLLSCFFVNLWFLVKDKFVQGIISAKYDKNIFPKYFRYSLKLYLGSITDFLIYRVDMYIIAYFLSNEALGLYVVAVNLVERLWMFSESIGQVLFVRLVNLKDEQIKNLLSQNVIKLSFYISLIGAIVLAFFAGLVVNLFFGREYSESVIFIYILLPGVVCQAAGMIMKRVLDSRGHPGSSANASIFCLIANLIGNFTLIPWMGVKGAAYSTSVSYVLFYLIQMLNVWKKFNLNPLSLILIKKEDINSCLYFLKKRKLPF